MTTEIIVEKVDREAAAAMYPGSAVSILAGRWDADESVQCFARHRLAERERVAAWLREDAGKMRADLSRLHVKKMLTPTQTMEWEASIGEKVATSNAIERGDHAIAMETGTAMTAGHGPKDDSAGRQASPERGRASGQEEG